MAKVGRKAYPDGKIAMREVIRTRQEIVFDAAKLSGDKMVWPEVKQKWVLQGRSGKGEAIPAGYNPKYQWKRTKERLEREQEEKDGNGFVAKEHGSLSEG